MTNDCGRSNIVANLEGLRREIDSTARACGRNPKGIHLLAVSKTFGPEAVREAWECGQILFGENRVQEAAAKIPMIQASGIQWHLIGHLQSNKVRPAVQLFDVIQSLDSEKIARRVADSTLELGKTMPVLIQVKVGKEPQKQGVLPEDLPALSSLVDRLPQLQLSGLMTIPPYHEQPERSRPYFRQMKELFDEVNRDRSQPMTQLSMGMSHDYHIAIEEGATLLRIGTKVFGPRQS